MRPTTTLARGERRAAALARVLLIGIIAGLASACGRPAAVELEHTRPSKEALAQAVVDAFAVGDRGALQALAISETEFRKYVWPELPASRPEVGMPVDYVWQDTSLKSQSDLVETIEGRRGRWTEVVSVTFDRPAANYGPIRVHPEARLTLRDREGRIETARLFGSLVESGRRWKVYSYIVD